MGLIFQGELQWQSKEAQDRVELDQYTSAHVRAEIVQKLQQ